MRAFFWIFLIIIIPGGLMLLLEAGFLDDLLDDIPAEPLVRLELEASVKPGELDARINQALDEGNQDDAEMYEEVAAYMGRDLEPETVARLEASKTATARTIRNTRSFFEGFISGEGSDTASFAGAVTSDLTVIGDVRDIGTEGSKMVAGEEYSKIILGLSVVGVAVTGATVATGGFGLPARVGVSLLKVAKKAGTLTKNFARQLGNLLEKAVDFPALRRTLDDVSLADPQVTRRAIQGYADNERSAELFPVLARMDDINGAVGPAESVRLMRYVDNTDDLNDMAKMTGTLGTKTRGIIELTGKTSLRAFKGVINLIRWLFEWIWAAAVAVAGWIFFAARRAVFRRREA